ncbi:MAG: dTDP-4-dehydrorhamnose reductase [Spirochaetia bacterium]|nr:dTDP-4-dehydrorhamnose reductase [Spirochaetia bacterium]
MILISGKSGQLGGELTELFEKEKVEFKAFDSREWDITDYQKNHSIIEKIKPNLIINCAAYTAVDKAESDIDRAYKVNRDALENIAKSIKDSSIKLLHISTDYVFSGIECGGPSEICRIKPFEPKDKTSPQSVYANSKNEGDKAVQKILSYNNKMRNSFIIRTSWLYSKNRNNFVKTMLRLAKDDKIEDIRVVEDQIGRPTWAARLAQFIFLFIKEKKLNTEPSIEGGLYHFANSGIASWYDFAYEIIKMAYELKIINRRKLVLPISTEEYPLPAKRPHYSVLNLESAKEVMQNIPHWKNDLNRCLREMKL